MASKYNLFAGAGDMGVRIRDHDWSGTRLGPIPDWSPALWSSLGICLQSSFPAAIYWGEDLHLLYNDAWMPVAGARHPWALGRPAREVWPDIWHIIEPQLTSVCTSGRGFITRDELLPMARGGSIEETYWDYSLTPITEPDGNVGGIFNQGHETTARVNAARHDALRVALAEGIRGLETTQEILAVALPLVGRALDAGRAGFAEIDADRALMHIEHSWTDGSIEPLTGTHPLDAFGDDLPAKLKTGQPVMIEDSMTDPVLAPEQRAHHARIASRACMAVPVVEHGRPVAVLFVHDRRARRWTAHHVAIAMTAAERLWQEVARARADMALRDNAERHRLIFEQTDAILFSTDPAGRITACNPAAARAFGRPVAELAMRPLAELIDANSHRTLAAATTNGGDTASADVTLEHDGEIRHLEATASPAIDRDGRAAGFHAVARDVTERRAGEQRQQRLVNELNHRVKNTLALVQALAIQSFREDRPLGEERAVFQQRLGALAAAHDLLTRTCWAGTTLPAVAADALRGHADAAARVTIAGPPLTLSPKAAISFALGLHELVVNAATHGALAVPEGRVTIGWAIADGRLRFEWRESGGPVVLQPARLGAGLRMTQRALAGEFRGQVRLDFAPGGFGFILDAPMPFPDRPDTAAGA